MPSKALENLDRRMEDVQQLLEAHNALTRFQRARRAAQDAGGGLGKVSEIVDRLVSQPGPGRPTQVGALNRAAIVLLCAHLQGYVEEVYVEAAEVLLSSSVGDLDALVARGTYGFHTPRPERIDTLFSSIGMVKLTRNLSWQGASNESVKRRLGEYVNLRNDIAHGKQIAVRKARVTRFKQFVDVFARNFDVMVAEEVRAITGKNPW